MPRLVRVKGVVLVPSDAERPPQCDLDLFRRHLEWTQRRYRELLFGRDTFTLVAEPQTLAGRQKSAAYREAPDGGAEAAVLELFEKDRCDRLSCPYIYVVLFVGTGGVPAGGGRPINGGVNTGGGVVILAHQNLRGTPNFQSTLQHELGHSFGLPHVDVYGYDMKANASLMSYNPKHHTKYLEPSATPGLLIPEDYRALGLNRRVFPQFRLRPASDYPRDYRLSPRPVFLGPQDLSGQLPYKGPSIGAGPAPGQSQRDRR